MGDPNHAASATIGRPVQQILLLLYLGLDPGIRGRLKYGWRNLDEVILGNLWSSTLQDSPVVSAAIRHSEVVARFGHGETSIRGVIKNAAD